MGNLRPDPAKFDKFKSESNGSIIAFVVAVTTIFVFGCIFLFANTSKVVASADNSGSIKSQMEKVTSDAFKSALGAMPDLPKLEEKMNILVMGVDWNGDEAERYSGTRSDTMMVVSLNPETNKVSIVSIPRDSRVVIPRGHGVNKINSAPAIGGPELAVRCVKENFNIPIDHYAVVDTKGLTELFSLLGPFKVVVEKEMHYHDKTARLDIDLMPGEQVLEAKELVGYLRFRHDAMADIGRMERQQWFLRQALDKVKDPSILLKAPQLIQIGYQSINTDLTIEEIASIYSFGKDLTTKDLVTATLPGHSEDIEDVNYLILSERGSQAIFTKLGIAPESRVSRFRNSDTPQVKRKKIRISIKCAKPMAEYADFLSSLLTEKGWRARYSVNGDIDECRHAQLNLNHTKTSNQALSLLKDDLPLVKDWPVVIKYGALVGSDIVLILPNEGGISRWYKAAQYDQKNLLDVPESDDSLHLKMAQAASFHNL